MMGKVAIYANVKKNIETLEYLRIETDLTLESIFYESTSQRQKIHLRPPPVDGLLAVTAAVENVAAPPRFPATLLEGSSDPLSVVEGVREIVSEFSSN